ncbi:hypothetical protein GYMLUDRAFT_250185 [Collybiopsis luxurians FD-317 M1]|uniref:Uncharacterized protein n=1 Tax=Collybiopsis luxurians FD-317 M1 TaxID=944289 RepID=A0A0D0CFJ3_9AGAR|nr:hypothetical protein GYMLUDRAFT_250185 [Collybiopsis luxurians FD-317 M1]
MAGNKNKKLSMEATREKAFTLTNPLAKMTSPPDVGGTETTAGVKPKQLDGDNAPSNKRTKKQVKYVTNDHQNNDNEVEELEAELEEMQRKLAEACACKATNLHTPEQTSTNCTTPAPPQKSTMQPGPIAHNHEKPGGSVPQSNKQPASTSKPNSVWPPLLKTRIWILQPTELVHWLQEQSKEAVGLKDDDAMYNRMLSATHKAGKAVHTDLSVQYKNQDPAKIYLVCNKVSQEVPYFDIRRFPGHWPIKEAYKQWIKNQQKQQKIKVRMGHALSLFGDTSVYVSDGEEDGNGAEGEADEGDN